MFNSPHDPACKSDQNDTRRAIFKSLIYLSIPTVIEHIMSTLMQYVDTAMVGHLGEQATAAVSTTTTVNWLVSSIPYALGIAVLALTSKASGAGDEAQAKRVAAQACYLTVITGLLLMTVCLLLSPYIPVWMRADKEIRSNAARYFRIVSIPMVFRTASIIFGAAIRAVKNTKTPMLINLVSNVINVLLNLLLIYGLRLGVTGAAIATAVCYTLSGSLMIYFAHREPLLRWTKKELYFDRKFVHQCGRIALPAAGNSVTSCLGYVFFAGMVSGMGTIVFAAHSIAVTAEELFYIPGYGLRTASSSLIGNAIGEGNERKTRITERLSVMITVGMMFVSGFCLYLCASPLMHLFTSSDEVAVLGAKMLRLIAFTEPFFGLMIALEGIFYGMGETKEILLIETFSMWGIRILFTFLCTQVWHLDLYAVWYCMIADNVCKAVLLLGAYLLRNRK